MKVSPLPLLLYRKTTACDAALDCNRLDHTSAEIKSERSLVALRYTEVDREVDGLRLSDLQRSFEHIPNTFKRCTGTDPDSS